MAQTFVTLDIPDTPPERRGNLVYGIFGHLGSPVMYVVLLLAFGVTAWNAVLFFLVTSFVFLAFTLWAERHQPSLYPGITTTELNAVAGARAPSLMNLSILGAPAVARVAVAGMLRRRRAVIPGWINKINAFFSQVLHRGFVTAAAGWLLEAANAPPATTPGKRDPGGGGSG